MPCVSGALHLGVSQAGLTTFLGDALINAKLSKHNSTVKKQNGPCFEPCEPQYFWAGLLHLFIISSVLAKPSQPCRFFSFRLFCMAVGKSPFFPW